MAGSIKRDVPAEAESTLRKKKKKKLDEVLDLRLLFWKAKQNEQQTDL